MTDRPTSLGMVLVILLTASAGVTETLERAGVWQLRSPLGEVAGTFLLVGEPGEARWRLEVGRDRADLLQRIGEGWTISRDRDAAFVQRWHGRWREIDQPTACFFQDLIGRLDEPRPGGSPAGLAMRVGARPAGPGLPLVLRSWDGLPRQWQPPRRDIEGGALRRQMVRRGLGRGGDGIVVQARESPDGALVLSTARWPGQIVIATARARATADLPDEAYLPLWPLGRFVP
jgi:hypothetical protein